MKNTGEKMKKKNIEELMTAVNELRKTGDLLLDEDLSIAIMNLISIEEHLYFSGMKTNKKKYFKLLTSIREIRKKLLIEIVKEPEGEVWCISKHLLATAMRLIEVGNKLLAEKKEEKAHEKFYDAFYLYSLFWEINSTIMNDHEVMKTNANNHKEKIIEIVKKIIDCCKE